MFALMLVGLMWLVVNYIAGPQIPFMVELGPWNYAIGFALFIMGLLMTMGWR
ncbi:Cell division protein CrgA [Corynebacterium freiburgense]|nr:Cell division protein CrgA [Corynebacterium freiburgense]